MKQLIEDAEFLPSIELRTIDWFLAEYRTQILPLDQYRRIIPAPGAPHILEKPRRLRHLADGELRGRFADQCEWLLAHQLANDLQVFDTTAWVEFCNFVRDEREQSGWTWGMGYKQRKLWTPEDTPGDPFGFERFGGSRERWYELLNRAK